MLAAHRWLLRQRSNVVPLSESFIRELHRHMLGQVWQWAGKYRRSDKNIGVPWRQIPEELEKLLGDARFWCAQSVFAIDEVVLQHVKAVGSLRQIDRHAYDQTPFAVNIDELNRFAFDELVPSLAMLRDAHVQFRLSHQSLGDLEQVSEVFCSQVQDNTRWKVFLFENDPDHLEKISRSFGTRTTFKKRLCRSDSRSRRRRVNV